MTVATENKPTGDSRLAPATHSANLRVYNTLTRTKEPFKTLRPGKVGIYLCGPTVYKEAHIGHMVGPVIFDTITRYLVYCGYEVEWVVNITDVDDKLIHQSKLRGIPMSQVATEMTMDYCANLLELGVDQITHMPKATEHIDEIIVFIQDLIAKGFAYQADGDVFFDVLKDREYGKLTNRSATEQQGEGGAAAGKKRSPGDFALWKGAKPGEPAWDSPWGSGRPGWHIECSAMSRRLLGPTFDIHGGGLDLTFPHHENEIAQSECCHGAPMATYWLHNGLMRASESAGKLGGKSEREGAGESANQDQASSAATAQGTVDTKISRSKGAGGLRQLIARHTGERIRFFIARTHYRSTIIFGDEPLAEAGAGLDKFYTLFERYERITGRSFYFNPDPEKEDRRLIARRADGIIAVEGNTFLQQVAEIRDSFLAKMDDDLNTGGGTSDLFQLVSVLNKFADDKKLEETSRLQADLNSFLRAMETLRELSVILGLFRKPVQRSGDERAAKVLDGLVKLLIQMRSEARANKDFAAADRIRQQLISLGVSLEDRKGETGWRLI
jgi:cysteinyl-tRNA synthetase